MAIVTGKVLSGVHFKSKVFRHRFRKNAYCLPWSDTDDVPTGTLVTIVKRNDIMYGQNASRPGVPFTKVILPDGSEGWISDGDLQVW